MNLILIGSTKNSVEKKIKDNEEQKIILSFILKYGTKIRKIITAREPLIMFALSFVKTKITK